jgi:hypothetical protein
MRRMRQIKNKQLTEHFSLHEIMEGTLPTAAAVMNWRHFNELNLNKITALCSRVEHIRAAINEKFKAKNDNKEIGLRVTSGFRCHEWELSQGRSGNSQHPISALDVQPSGVSKQLSDEIMNWAAKNYSPVKTGWKGGFAIKKPTENTLGFLHFDNREKTARWIY